MRIRRAARPDGLSRQDGGADADFTAWALSSADRLRDTAYLMCRDRHLADDLTQTALIKLYVVWPRVAKAQDVDAYARKVLLRSLLDHRRRRWIGEVPTGALPDAAGVDSPDLRLTLIDALAELKPLDRAVVVLRYWEDYSVEQVGAMLDLGEGAVRNRSMRSLAKLREILGVELTDLLS